MNDTQIMGAVLLGLLILMPFAFAIPLCCRWAVETGGYRHLCLTRKGAERLAAWARDVEGWPAVILRAERGFWVEVEA